MPSVSAPFITRRVMDGSDTEGIFVPGQDPAYLNQLVTRLAQTAGAPGTIDWTSGEYIQDTQPFLDTFEFLKSLLDDGLLHSASPSMGDRKSTRLNSSHVAISYAVFCLKNRK